MQIVKKLIFAPIFLIFFIILFSQLAPLFRSYDFIFALSLETLIHMIVISILLGLTSLSFVLFATFSSDWKFIVPVGVLASILPMIFFDPALGVILAVGILVSLLIIYVNLENTLKTYLTFQGATLLGPSIRHLSTLLMLSLCITYFLSVNKLIQEKGFQIPDSLIETALKLSPIESRHPEMLDSINQPKQQKSLAPKDLTENLIKQTVKDQFENLLKPYSNFVAPTLALLLFFTLQGLTSFINLLIYPLIWIIFYILQKTGFIKFTEETRVVKKMVV